MGEHLMTLKTRHQRCCKAGDHPPAWCLERTQQPGATKQQRELDISSPPPASSAAEDQRCGDGIQVAPRQSTSQSIGSETTESTRMHLLPL